MSDSHEVSRDREENQLLNDLEKIPAGNPELADDGESDDRYLREWGEKLVRAELDEESGKSLVSIKKRTEEQALIGFCLRKTISCLINLCEVYFSHLYCMDGLHRMLLGSVWEPIPHCFGCCPNNINHYDNRKCFRNLLYRSKLVIP